MTYFLVVLVVSTGMLLAFVASPLPSATRIGFVAFAVVIAAVLVLLVYQPLGHLSLSAAVLMASAFIAPLAFVHETFDATSCNHLVPSPCDPATNNHLGLRLGLFAILLFAALVTAAVGLLRSFRSH